MPRVLNPAGRVSTVELLFDLVFVFTITQVTEIVVEDPTWAGVIRAVVVMAVVWWMYDAYAWLTNHAAPDSAAYRIPIVGAMAAFLVIALAVPEAFGEDGLAFGLAYLVVVLIHTALFVHGGSEEIVRSMLRVAPLNALSAGFLIAAGFVDGAADWVLWGLAIATHLSIPLWSVARGFNITAAHFVERHGLLMIIAFGESIVAVGIGAAGLHVDLALVAGAVLAVGIVAGMWWCYFTGDDERAEHSIARMTGDRRSNVAITAFYVDHLVMIMGLVFFAAGVKKSIAHVMEVAHQPAPWLLAGGVALYLLGDAAYRHELRLGAVRFRLAGAVVVAATGLVGSVVAAGWQLLILLAVLIGIIVVERYLAGSEESTVEAAD